MSRTFLNQSTQIASSETYEDTLAIGSTMEYTRAEEKTIHDDLNALRTMIRAAMGTSNWYDAPASNIESLETSKVSKAGDTMTGPLDMGSNYITNLTSPMNENDAASKVYVDTVVGGIPVRIDRVFAKVTAACSAGNDLTGMGAGANLDDGLPMFSAATFAADYDIFMNGQLLRPGSDYDVTIGGSGDNEASLKLTYDAVVGDVLCVISYAAPGYSGGGGGGPTPAGSGTYTVSYYGPSPLGGAGGGDMVLGLSDGTSVNIPLAYNMGVSTVTVNGETLTIDSDHAGSGLPGFPAGDNYFVGFSTEFIVAPSVGDTATFAADGAGGGAVSYTVSFYSSTHIGFSNGSADDVSLPGFNKDNSTMTINGETVTLGGMSSSNIGGVNHTTYLYTPAFSSAPSLGDSATYTP